MDSRHEHEGSCDPKRGIPRWVKIILRTAATHEPIIEAPSIGRIQQSSTELVVMTRYECT